MNEWIEEPQSSKSIVIRSRNIIYLFLKIFLGGIKVEEWNPQNQPLTVLLNFFRGVELLTHYHMSGRGD